MVLTLYQSTPKASELSDQATTDRDWVSVNINGYKVQASMFSTVV